MIKARRIICFLSLAIGLIFPVFHSTVLYSQQSNPDKEAGNLFVRHYHPNENKGFPQNWSAIQDSRGVMVFANGDGILKFDGVTWQLHALPGLPVVRSLAMDTSGRVYVGAYDEIGYLDADSLGNFQYISLLPLLSDEQKGLGNVFKIYCVDDSAIFQTEKGVLILRNNQFHAINWRETNFRKLFFADGTVYAARDSLGLCRLQDGEFKKVNGGDFFIGKRIREILPFDKVNKLILTSQHGLFLYNEHTITPFKTEIDDFLIASLAYCAIGLSNGDYAIGTLHGGAIIIDKNGRLKFILNKSTGLGDMAVYNFCLDRQGALWVTMGQGISRVETHTSISYFLQNSGIEGSVNAIDRVQGTLYVATSQGLYKLNETKLPDVQAHFERINELKTGAWGLANVGNGLIVNTEEGAFILQRNKFKQLNNYPSYSLFPMRSDKDIIISGLSNGLSVLKKVNGSWVDGGRMNGIKAETGVIEESVKGDLWVGSYSEGLFLLKFPSKEGKTDYLNPVVRNFGERDGIKTGYTKTFLIGDREVFYVRSNDESAPIYLFDDMNGKFTEYHDFASDLGLVGISGYPITNEQNNRFWIRDDRPANNDRIIVERKPDKTFDVKRISFSRLAQYPLRIVFEDDDIAWWGGHEGVVRLEISRMIKDQDKPFNLHINKITLSGDSVLFKGTDKPLEQLQFPFELNTIRFEYASTSYDAHQDNQYQYILEGFDDDWSGWTKETDKSYTRVPEGSYVFKVKAKNIYDENSNIASYSFSISPPWFRSWWMYFVYAGAVILVVMGIVQWRSSQIKKEKENLEQIVTDRTKEVKEQAAQLEQQAIRLRELDQAKSRFFANISHEFRTPLTLISGGLQDLENESETEGGRSQVAVIRRNTVRLQQLIEQLLDLSKLENGKLQLVVGKGHPGSFLRAISSSFSSWASQKGIDLSVHVSSDNNAEAYFDEDIIEKIVNNLLSNAIKFTRPHGKVELKAGWDSQRLQIEVSDNGPGIEQQKLTRIFERFYQVDDSSTRSEEGSGIGLALVKELVTLHRGKIWVESQPGERTTFAVEVPIHKKFYSASELVENRSDAVDETRSPKKHLSELSLSYEDDQTTDAESPIILVVEDNIDLGNYIKDHLPGHTIILANNGVDGLGKALQHIPDLILSDVMMPVMDGVELCRKIKEDEVTSHIPVILLTAKADVESRIEGLETGADDYMTKPFDARELQTRVNNLIHQRQKLRSRFSRTVILKPKEIAISSRDETFLEKVMAIVENNLSNSEFTVEDFQKDIGMSRMQLHRKLKALSGHSTSEFIRSQRLIRASELLIKTDGNITEVCYQTGFTSLSYFAKCFKKQFGATPKEFAASHSKVS